MELDGTSSDVAAIAGAAQRACEQAGGSKRRIVLALGEGLVQHRLVELPVALARAGGGELDRALHRKAAALLGCEAREALFAALLVDAGSEDRDDARPTSWLVTAFRKSVVPRLHQALDRRGLVVHRVASLRLAAASGANERRSTEKGACIVVVVERTSVTLTLVHEGLVVNVGSLRGSFADEPALAMTLLQEIKGLDIHWRKQSRGESVSEIVLLGLPHDRGELFVGALKSAHKEVAVMLLRDERAELPRDVAARTELLRLCRSTAGMQLDLTPHARAHRGRRLAVAGIALLVTGTLAWLGWDVQRESRKDHERMLAEFVQRGADLEELQQRETEARGAMEQLQRTVAREDEIAHAGIELAGLLDQVRAGLGADVALLGLRLLPSEGATKVEIEGETSSQPIVAAANIARAARALEASPFFEDVEVRPAPLPLSPSMPVHFQLSARAELQR